MSSRGGVVSTRVFSGLRMVSGYRKEPKNWAFSFQMKKREDIVGGIAKSYFWLIIKKYLDMKGNYYC